MGRRKMSAAAPPSRSWSNVGGGVVSELREKHKMELENLTLMKQPLRTLHFFMLAMLRYLKRLATYILSKSGLFVLLIVLVVAPGILLFFSDGLHKKHVQEFLNYAKFVLWWVSLGVASSIGLGSGLHTFVLYLGPHIALFTIKAVQCGRVDLKMAPYDTIQLKVGPSWLDKKCSEFGPPVYPASAHSVRIPVFDLLPQIQLEAVLWGIGTALGELPPYFISRAARLSGSKSKAVKELDAATSKEDSSVASTLNRTKRWLLSHSQHLNFFTILILASVPNPLFDLAGIMCGQFGVPFWEFFFATLIGKAIIKTHIQTLFIVSLCNNQLLYLMEKELIWIFGHIPGFSATLPSVIAKLHAAKEKYLSPPAPASPSSQMEDKQWNFSFTLVWNTVVWLVLVRGPRFSYYSSAGPLPMAQEQEPLLQNGSGGNAAVAKGSSSPPAAALPSLARTVLKFLMWALFLTWAAGVFLYPTKPAQVVFKKWIGLTRESLFGITGSIFLTFSAPILTIAVLAYVYITFFPSDHVEKKKLRSLSFRLWTFPVLVDGPFGVVSAVEFIGIILFIVYVVYSMTFYVVESASLVSKFDFPSGTKSELLLDVIGLRLGSVGLFCMLFLFLPVARGSVLLRLIDIPFEHATRYHVWLGHLTMALFTLHGLCYAISWSMQGRLTEEMLEWKQIGVANLPGVISLAAGLLMWVTSLHPVRKRFFELFFYTHQLYVIFIVFLAFHVGDFIFSISAGAVFLFMLDRFLRFWQSRAKVDIISAACHPCGTVELVFSKPASLRYNALSFIFIQVRELSFLQWHPFSVSSSPMDGRYHMSVLIKVLGTWTEKLRSIITDVQEQNRSDAESQCGRITACVEGPYGHESPYHLMYENLVLVAGGIGISPFLAILSDIIHRIEEGKPCMPKNVLVLWSVKKSKELSLLSAVDAQTITSSVSDKLRLDIQAFVTQESQPPLEDGIVEDDQKAPGMFVKNGTTMSGLVGTGDNFWAAMYFSASTIGFVLAYALVQVYYVKPYHVVAWWYLGLLFMLCMVAGVALPGGLVVLLWHLSEKRRVEDDKWDAAASQSPRAEQMALAAAGDDAAPSVSLAGMRTTRYGCRPNFEAEFVAFAERVGNAADVGVLVCGPQGLQTSVARECRARNLGGGGGAAKKSRSRAVFHFNSHSFDL